MLLPMLDDAGIKSLVYTRDPNLTDEVFKNLTAGVDKIRVIKKTASPEADDPLYRRVCAGMVTHGDKSNAINMILGAKKYVKLQSRLSTFELISMIVGAVFAAVVSIACTLILLISKGNICSKIATTLDFAALIASVCGGAIAFFTTTNRFPMDMIIDELNSGTYFILAGWIASFILLLISSGIKINLENKE